MIKSTLTICLFAISLTALADQPTKIQVFCPTDLGGQPLKHGNIYTVFTFNRSALQEGCDLAYQCKS